MSHVDFEVQCTWDGEPLAQQEWARLGVRVDRAAGILDVTVEAAYFGDPYPQVPPGSTDRLWDFEVVELFLLGDDAQYLEIELGPHGHFLGLRLAGRRHVIARDMPIDFQVERAESSWQGRARIALDWLPMPIRAANVYAIHGNGLGRRYLAAHPVPGSAPDFHALEHFAPIDFES